jgi:hypothetical protein
MTKLWIDHFRTVLIASLGTLWTLSPCLALPEYARPLIFPAPKEIAATGDGFVLDDRTTIVLPARASEQDLFLAGILRDEIGDRFSLHIKTERVATLDRDRRMILVGSIANPLVKAYCAKHKIEIGAQSPGPEGYVLRVDANVVFIAGSDDRGAFYGVQSLRQLAEAENGQVRFHAVEVRDWPDKPFRGVTIYMPGRANIPFFKRFVRDFMALYKYNTLILEMNASMRFDRHPELNSGWLDFVRDNLYGRHNYPPGALHGREPNSTHYDTADGDILEKAEVADLANWVKRYHIELVPELPSFTHSYYLLSTHKDLAEVPGEKWPDTYCPSNPKSYELLFDVYDEYIDLLKPKMVHAGHDELFMPVGLCPLCKDKDIDERFGEDVKKIHDYLARKGVKMAIWGDMLLQGVRGTGLKKGTYKDGTVYYSPGGMTHEQVARLIPKDVLLFNWFWQRWSPERSFEAELDQMGFRQVYGNFTSNIRDYETRRKQATILGGAPSAWFATNEVGFGKELMSDLLGCASTLWSSQVIPAKELSATVQAMLPEIRVRWHGEPPPSQTEASVVPVNITASFNMAAIEKKLDVDLSGMQTGPTAFGKLSFDLGTAGGNIAAIAGTDGKESAGLPKEVSGIPVGADASSLIFLHASAKPAFNRQGDRVIWDKDDTADLLGWYEVVYEDGFVTTVPIRYGVNIQEWNWDKRTSALDYCYGADAVPVGGPENNRITFFAYEWTNPRLGKAIKEVRLHGTTGFRGAARGYTDDYGPVIPNNGVILKAISVVKRR